MPTLRHRSATLGRHHKVEGGDDVWSWCLGCARFSSVGRCEFGRVPDLKEGLYFGEDLDASDPRVIAGWPLHGANLFPKDMPELAVAVRTFLAEAERAA